ncbi:protoporphyrinogen oxidase [bacterium K02(2017)]|nr:protoporphyrinogen oxidase [bacterium K02(2017)]
MSKPHDILIIGAGISGLSTAHFLKKQNPDLDICILDKSDSPGGAVKTHSDNGYQAEWGPHGFLDNVAESNELLKDLNCEDQVERASLKKFERYICLGGKLRAIPQSPFKILKSNIMPFTHKLRFLGDLFKKPILKEQTIKEWVTHRFGKGLLPFADAVFTGTYAGDFERLSINATMPGVRHLELEHGSVIKGAFKSRHKKKKSGFPSMVSFKNGMQEIITQLLKHHPVQTNQNVTNIVFEQDGWKIKTQDQNYQANKLILAVPLNTALKFLSPLKVAPITKVPEAKILSVLFGFDKHAKIPFGFGYLSPESENRFSLGCLFSTHMFAKRAPKDHQLIEVLVGGRRHPERLELSDQELIDKSLEDISQLIDLPNKPLYQKVIRPESSIPQLELNHLALQNYKKELESQFSTLSICGFGWEGIGLNDMIKKGKELALKNTANLNSQIAPEVKKVYF